MTQEIHRIRAGLMTHKIYLVTVHDFADPDVPTVRTYAYNAKWKAIRSGIKIINILFDTEPGKVRKELIQTFEHDTYTAARTTNGDFYEIWMDQLVVE